MRWVEEQAILEESYKIKIKAQKAAFAKMKTEEAAEAAEIEAAKAEAITKAKSEREAAKKDA